ncbi:MAG: hypothetical protein P1V81_17115, partial [Planctomycetota bacterium]|nr:hypothetical protein [Planctomycetota bacterium]
LTVDGATPGGVVLVGLSITGQGPYPSYWGLADLSPPVHVLPLAADAAGLVQVSLPLNPALAGTPLFAKGVDLTGSVPTNSSFGMIQ